MSHAEMPPASFNLVRLDDLCAAAGEVPWLWHGYLAHGAVTLLTAQWKSGKTTLVALLLARMKAGGMLAGRTVAAGRAAVVSEEGPDLWAGRARKLDLGDNVYLFSRPFAGRPRPDEWRALVDQLGALNERAGVGLAVIDTLASLMPVRNENNAGGMLAALQPLRRLTDRGMAVLVLHHPRKGEVRAGQASRGSGALAGHVDVLLEMDWYGSAASADRRRKLRAFSRYEETPPRQVIELTADGTDYVARGAFEDDQLAQGWRLLSAVLAAAGGSLTRQEVLRRWPEGFPPPNEVTLWRWLERARQHGLVEREGTGRRDEPYRFRPASRRR